MTEFNGSSIRGLCSFNWAAMKLMHSKSTLGEDKIEVIKVKGTTMLAEKCQDLKYTVKSQYMSELQTTV